MGIDGRGGGGDYLTFIMVEQIKQGRSLFLSGERRERDLFLAFTPWLVHKIAPWFYVSLF